MKRSLGLALCLVGVVGISLEAGCGESREERLKRELSYNAKEKTQGPTNLGEPIPPHPTRDALNPLLSKLYSGNRMPDVLEADIAVEGNYELTAGVLSVIRIKKGLSKQALVRAIITGTAEADAWVHRDNARKAYADHIHKVMRSFGDDQKLAVLSAYGQLKLLDFFSGSDADAAIAALPADLKGIASSMQSEFKSAHEKVWADWMAVKMFARREVASDEPFRSVLKGIRKHLGKEEPKPLSWAESHDKPFVAWSQKLSADKELFGMLTNLREYREQEGFRADTHTIWAMEGSSMIPEKARGAEFDKELGFAVHREDLGGGYQEMTFVFPKRLKGAKLKEAYLRSHIYRHIFSDFMLLATSGGDFKEGVVPDKYDQAYARCGSKAALSSLVGNFKSKFSLLSDVRVSSRNSDKLLEVAHKCIIKECSPDIKNPPKDDPLDMEGPAPGSRLGFFQMLARFEDPKVNLAAMRKAAPKSQAELDAEAFLKANKNKPR